jgi:hypothetical protein
VSAVMIKISRKNLGIQRQVSATESASKTSESI